MLIPILAEEVLNKTGVRLLITNRENLVISSYLKHLL